MTSKRLFTSRFHYLLIGALIVMISGVGSLGAQESAPPPSYAQVISQGIDFVPGENVHWRAEVIPVEPLTNEKPVELAGGFIYSPEGTLIASRSQGDAELISPNQATFAPSGVTKSIYSADDTTVDALKVELATGAVLDTGAVSKQFQVPEGDYNLQLTRGLLNRGDVDVFTPVNDAIYFLWVPAGTIEVNTLDEQDHVQLVTGDTMEARGELGIQAVGTEPAAYVIVAIGELVPNLPEPNVVEPDARTGEILMLFYNCDTSAFAAADTDGCELNWEPIPVTLVADINDTVETRTSTTNAAQLPDGTWLFADTPAGEWSFALDASAIPEQSQYVLGGDGYQANGGWWVTVSPDTRSVVQVLINTTEAAEVSAITILYIDCPSADVEYSVSMDCDLAMDHPVGYLQGPDSDPSVQTTSQQATNLDIGTYRFEGLPVGTYSFSIEYNDTWTPDNAYFVGDGYMDGATWYIDLEVGPYPVVYIAREGAISTPVTPDAPDEEAYGYVLIMQNECSPTQDAENCVLALDPWEVVLTNTGTGEAFTLTQNGTPTTPGTWQLLMPAGIYQVEVYDAGWTMDYPSQLEVFPDGEVWLFIDGYAP